MDFIAHRVLEALRHTSHTLPDHARIAPHLTAVFFNRFKSVVGECSREMNRVAKESDALVRRHGPCIRGVLPSNGMVFAATLLNNTQATSSLDYDGRLVATLLLCTEEGPNDYTPEWGVSSSWEHVVFTRLAHLRESMNLLNQLPETAQDEVMRLVQDADIRQKITCAKPLEKGTWLVAPIRTHDVMDAVDYNEFINMVVRETGSLVKNKGAAATKIYYEVLQRMCDRVVDDALKQVDDTVLFEGASAQIIENAILLLN